jgi:hypothetical protein
MKLEELCMEMIKEKIGKTRAEINDIARKTQMGIAICQGAWEPISKGFDEILIWLEGLAEYQIIVQAAIKKTDLTKGS